MKLLPYSHQFPLFFVGSVLGQPAQPARIRITNLESEAARRRFGSLAGFEDWKRSLLVPAQLVAPAALQRHNGSLGALGDLIKLRRQCNGCGRLTSRDSHLVWSTAECVIGAVSSGATHGIANGDRPSNWR